MEEMLLADKYAKGLLCVACEENIIDQLDVELKMFAAILEKQNRLREILLSPIIPLQEKNSLLHATFKKQWISPYLESFLYLLLEKGRFNLFDAINKIYKDLIYSLRKKLKVFVESALALDTEQKKALKAKLVKIYQRNIDLFVRINSSLIGGAKIYVGHTLFDGTVQRRLAFLRDHVM